MLKRGTLRTGIIVGLVTVIVLILIWTLLPIGVSNFIAKGMHTQNGFFTTIENGWLIKFFVIIGIIAAKKYFFFEASCLNVYLVTQYYGFLLRRVTPWLCA